mgnify:CR=1 FL=1
MPPSVASLVFTAAIVSLFVWDWRLNGKTSSALAIPALFMFVVASRPVSIWIGGPVWSAANDLSEGSPLDATFYLVLQLLAAFVLIRRAKKVQVLLRAAWPLLVFLGYCLLSLTWSDFPFVALKRWVKIVGDAMMVLVVATDSSPVTAVKRFIAWPGFVLIPLSVLFIKYYPELGHGYDAWTGAQYFQGVSYNKNGLGVICLYWGIGYAWILIESLRQWRKNRSSIVLTTVFVGICIWLLLLSDSKTSLACFVIAITMLSISKLLYIRTRPVLIHLIVLLMLLVPAAVLFLGVSPSAIEAIGRDSTLTDRTLLWEEIFSLRVNPIVGAGYESFWLGDRLRKLWGVFWWRPTQSHNGYIEMYINLGLIGLGLLAAVLYRGYLRTIAAVHRQEVCSGLFLAFIVATIPYNFTEAAYRLQNVPWVFSLLAVVGLPLIEAGKQVASVRMQWMVPARASVVRE